MACSMSAWVYVSGSDQAMDLNRDKRVEANSKARVRTDGGVVGKEGGQRGKSCWPLVQWNPSKYKKVYGRAGRTLVCCC